MTKCQEFTLQVSQKISWIDEGIIYQLNWVRELDRKLVAQGRQIALINDNCPAHPDITGLEIINRAFLPPNTTSKIQPVYQGVIRSLKAHYRAKLVRKQIANIEMKREVLTIFK